MSTVDLSGALWRKSSYSGNGTDDNCVQVGVLVSVVAIRDTKSPGGPLIVSRTSWAHFAAKLTAVLS